MKWIIDSYTKEASKEINNPSNLIKSRLRGKGSGYKEGADKQGYYYFFSFLNHFLINFRISGTLAFVLKLSSSNIIFICLQIGGRAFIDSYDYGLRIKKMECSNIKALHENTKTQHLNNK